VSIALVNLSATNKASDF